MNEENKKIEIAKRIIEAFKDKEGVYGKKEVPECLKSEAIKDEIERAKFITLVVSIDYQKDADKLWNQAKEMFDSAETRWIFEPSTVIKKKFFELLDVFDNKFTLTAFKDSLIWYKICLTLSKDFKDNPILILKVNDFDAEKIRNYFEKNPKKFPYLKGPKIRPLWLRIINETIKGIDLKNLDKVSIPVDVHIANATYYLGLIDNYHGKVINKIRRDVQNIWDDICKKIEQIPLDFDEPLWILSHEGCSKKICPLKEKGECPVSQFCRRGVVNGVGEIK